MSAALLVPLILEIVPALPGAVEDVIESAQEIIAAIGHQSQPDPASLKKIVDFHTMVAGQSIKYQQMLDQITADAATKSKTG